MKRVRCWSCNEWMLIQEVHGDEPISDMQKYCDACRKHRPPFCGVESQVYADIQYHGDTLMANDTRRRIERFSED